MGTYSPGVVEYLILVMVVNDLARRTLQAGSGTLQDRLQKRLGIMGLVEHFEELGNIAIIYLQCCENENLSQPISICLSGGEELIDNYLKCRP